MGYDKPIRSFTDLYAWQEAHKLVLQVYKLIRNFPIEEKYGLNDQLRRASVSISSNIAEGFGRKCVPEKVRFYYIAHGSLTEVQNQLLIARDVGYIDEVIFSEINNQLVLVQKLINGLIRSTKL